MFITPRTKDRKYTIGLLLTQESSPRCPRFRLRRGGFMLLSPRIRLIDAIYLRSLMRRSPIIFVNLLNSFRAVRIAAKRRRVPIAFPRDMAEDERKSAQARKRMNEPQMAIRIRAHERDFLVSIFFLSFFLPLNVFLAAYA